MATYVLEIAYDGSGFHGYARQPGVRTVQGELEEALFKHTGPVATSVAGRTDAGVHARGQVVSFSFDQDLALDRVAGSLSSMLYPEIVVTGARVAAGDFDARRSAVARRYRYHVLNTPAPDPLRRHASWHLAAALDVVAMQQAASALIGTRDFASFCRKASGRSSERTVLAAEWSDAGDGLLAFDIEASSFCHQMVRSIVALCSEIGRGRRSPGEIPAVIAARDRNAASGAAPPHGLTLWSVRYGDGE